MGRRRRWEIIKMLFKCIYSDKEWWIKSWKILVLSRRTCLSTERNNKPLKIFSALWKKAKLFCKRMHLCLHPAFSTPSLSLGSMILKSSLYQFTSRSRGNCDEGSTLKVDLLKSSRRSGFHSITATTSSTESFARLECWDGRDLFKRFSTRQ